MKTQNENRKGWLKSFAFVATLVAISQVFVACGGGSGSSTPVYTTPIGVGVGLNTFNAANCGGTVTPGFIACAIGRAQGFEVLVQISAASGVSTGVGGYGGTGYGGIGGIGSSSYTGPVLVNGVVNVLPGYGCAAATSFSFTANTGSQMMYSSATGQLYGTVTATGTTTMQILFGNTFLSANGVAAVSSTGQSFPYVIMNQIQVSSTGYAPGYGTGYPGYGTGVGYSGQCSLPSGVYFLD